MRSTAVLFAVSALVSSALGATYKIKDSFVGEDFLCGFSHQTFDDPTHGRVDYVNEKTALAQNLTFASDDTFIMRADSFNKVGAGERGRKSVRIQSNEKYSTHVTIFDIRHMPQGCGTWPAAWEVGDNWPNQGEVDILEGTNDIEPNRATLHTGANCAQPGGRAMTGKSAGKNCDVAQTGNSGCGVSATTPNSYGKSFNSAGGGYYAMERTDKFIKVFYWARNDPAVPADVKTAGDSINTDAWGTPTALFVNDQCDLNAHFGPHNIVINLTFCGDWADASYASGGCPGSCKDHVDNNPEAFADAYWDFAGVHVYE